MEDRNFRLRVVVKGNKRLRDDVVAILKDYLREGGMSEEKILQVLDVTLEKEERALSTDLPMIGTQDIRGNE